MKTKKTGGLAETVRAVYRRHKRDAGRADEYGYKSFPNVINEARRLTANTLGLPIRQVKELLAETAGPKTTKSNQHFRGGGEHVSPVTPAQSGREALNDCGRRRYGTVV